MSVIDTNTNFLRARRRTVTSRWRICPVTQAGTQGLEAADALVAPWQGRLPDGAPPSA
jgi:hypothetical protein